MNCQEIKIIDTKDQKVLFQCIYQLEATTHTGSKPRMAWIQRYIKRRQQWRSMKKRRPHQENLDLKNAPTIEDLKETLDSYHNKGVPLGTKIKTSSRPITKQELNMIAFSSTPTKEPQYYFKHKEN